MLFGPYPLSFHERSCEVVERTPLAKILPLNAIHLKYRNINTTYKSLDFNTDYTTRNTCCNNLKHTPASLQKESLKAHVFGARILVATTRYSNNLH
jgi:hypothetical protein